MGRWIEIEVSQAEALALREMIRILKEHPYPAAAEGFEQNDWNEVIDMLRYETNSILGSE